MRILMLSQFYPPIIGGGAKHVQSLSAELVSHGHEVVVVTLWHQDLAEFELDQGVRVYRIRSSLQQIPWLFRDNGRQYAPPFPDPGVMLALRRIIVHERPEIVHAHNWLVYSFLPLKVWSGAKLVVTLHNYSLVCAKMLFLHQGTPCEGPAFTKCLGCASQFYGLAKGVPVVLANQTMGLMMHGVVDMFLAVSQAVADGNRLVGSRLPFQVMPNFLSSDDSGPQDDAGPYLAQLPDDGYLLFVGALGRLKGVDVLLRAYADLTNAPPLVLIGYETPEWSVLAENCPPNVFVLKDWPSYAVMEAWRRSIVALAPSVWAEPCATVVMEAMLAGRPVIASRIGGMIDMVDEGETGLLVQPGDYIALRQAIEHLLANANLRSTMGQAALRKVLAFQAATVVPRIEQVYRELLQKEELPERNGLYGDSVKAGKA